MIDGRTGRTKASDGVEAGWIDGVWTDDAEFQIAGEGLLKCKVQLRGESRYIYGEKQEDNITGPSLIFLNHTNGLMKREATTKGTRERSLVLIIPLTEEELGGCSREDATVERTARALSNQFYLRHYQVPRAALACVQTFFDNQVSAQNSNKFIQTKVDELTCIVLDSLFGDFQPLCSQNATVREVRRAHEVRDIILADLSVTPQLAKLSLNVGLNRTRLTQAFKEVFGASIFQFLLQERMSLAWRLLEKREMSGSAVAEACGYEHYSNFSSAFKNHFGIAPSLLRDH